ncbi:MAG: 4-hydroxy-tetrahydrodipicolinate synthase [Porphyromonas sp.]|nr:4-hydroxy-tetrahydrodipicolinate synthase [Porphyromonas sp.]
MLHDTKLFRGLGTALVCPFLPDGAIDYASLGRLVDFLVDNGVDFLVVHGTTGESPCLGRNERNDVTAYVVERTAGRVPIMIGLGGNNTLELGERLRELDTTGLSGVLSVVPYYNKPTQEGLYRHFAHLAECSPLPIVLYNVPGRVGINMTPEVVARLASEYPNIIGVKEASGYTAQTEAISKLVQRQDFCILSGDDNITVDHIRNGACGVISVVGNAYPRYFGEAVHAALDGRLNEADMLVSELREVNVQLFANGNPGGIKALLYQKGIIEHNELRLPLVPVSEEVFRLMNEARQAVDAIVAARYPDSAEQALGIPYRYL